VVGLRGNLLNTDATKQEFNMKSRIVLAFAAASTMSLGAIAQGVVAVQVAPPPPVIESVPAPRPGFIWSPGHYVWRDGGHVWVSGQWVESRPGYAWAAPHWQQRPDGSWHLVGGAFVPRHEARIMGAGRDRDRDGTPDQADADKDNDGVPNRYDSHPNNRWRD
jgi:hypothetical protein